MTAKKSGFYFLFPCPSFPLSPSRSPLSPPSPPPPTHTHKVDITNNIYLQPCGSESEIVYQWHIQRSHSPGPLTIVINPQEPVTNKLLESTYPLGIHTKGYVDS